LTNINNGIDMRSGSIKYRAGGYFMSQEDQDAVIGRVVRELNDSKNLCAALTVEANRIGAALVSLGSSLQGDPDQVAKVAFTNQAVSLAYQPVNLFAEGDVDEIKIGKLTEDLRSVLSAMRRLGEHAARLGV
jgi:hypothetical protein